ncbi:uncharacterized protein LOC111866057 isoform X2 [Cryptotermes secundus]|uniref:uncharacterized protein LOC111866057 isoform X2 n=1 Tax=Cryptotermes secundus TaxID=105785 RepID=UPI000CD7BD14|nr:uncharacterized protein LOC111866057 isoform X2 [Cryptotermes secundus]
MDATGTGLKASGDTNEAELHSDGTESSAVIALRNLGHHSNTWSSINMMPETSSFQMEMSQQIEKFTSEMETIVMQEKGSSPQSIACGPVTQLDMRLRKAELIIQIQSMVAFLTNKLHEHQLMEKIDSEPSIQ